MTEQRLERTPKFEIAQELGLAPHLGATAMLGDSAHGVCVAADEDANLWVVKSASYEKAHNEVYMLQEMQRAGVPSLTFQNGKEPRIFEVSRDEHAIVMPYERLRPLTQLNWSAPSYEVAAHDVLDKHTNRAIHTVAKMHKRGLYHGDYQVKNNGLLTTRTGHARQVCFDFEGSGKLGKWYEDESQHKIMVDDVKQLFKSMLINRYLVDLPLGLKMEKLSELALEYSDKLTNRDYEHAEIALRIGQTILDKTEDWVSQPGAIKRARRRFKKS